MIPATQRPDGTWRKARKIRAGFNSSSGGATRYVPPAFRNTAGGSDKDGNGREGYGHARSLSEVAATDGPGGTRRFLDAAIFLLTVKTSAPPATAQIENEGGKGEGSGSGGGSRAGGMALRLPLRSAARAAKETLGCNGCRTLSPEPRPATAVHVTAAAALADIATGPEQSESSDDDQERGERDTTSSSDDWWARLRQVEQGWISSEADFHDGSRRDEESWIGLHLKLRPSDVHCVEGRIAIVDFLKGRLGKQVVGRDDDDDDDDDDEEKEEEGHAEGGENDNTSLLKETHPQDVTKPADPTPSPAVTNIPTAVGGEEESGERTGGLPSSSKRSGSNNSNSSNEQRSPRVIGTIMDAVEGQESGPQAAEGGVTVVVGVLVLGSELSKRDRAELHGQAEKAGGVASSSHGVGGGRFLSLTCSLANRTGAVELELSAEQAELARRLFRLAQQEYHSRYECLSHREIREVVFRGGPSAKDHPDLFRLMERHRQKQSDKDGPPTKGKRSGDASTNKATAGGNPASAPPAATRGASPDQSGGVGATSDQKNQRLNGVDAGVAQSAAAVLLPPSGGSRADEEVPPPFSVRGRVGSEGVVDVEEGQKTPDLIGSREKCPW